MGRACRLGRSATIIAMRLSTQQVQTIVSLVQANLGPDAGVALFGSRLRDCARGGDVDLLAVQRGRTASAFAQLAQRDRVSLNEAQS